MDRILVPWGCGTSFKDFHCWSAQQPFPASLPQIPTESPLLIFWISAPLGRSSLHLEMVSGEVETCQGR